MRVVNKVKEMERKDGRRERGEGRSDINGCSAQTSNLQAVLCKIFLHNEQSTCRGVVMAMETVSNQSHYTGILIEEGPRMPAQEIH